MKLVEFIAKSREGTYKPTRPKAQKAVVPVALKTLDVPVFVVAMQAEHEPMKPRGNTAVNSAIAVENATFMASYHREIRNGRRGRRGARKPRYKQPRRQTGADWKRQAGDVFFEAVVEPWAILFEDIRAAEESLH